MQLLNLFPAVGQGRGSEGQNRELKVWDKDIFISEAKLCMQAKQNKEFIHWFPGRQMFSYFW